jgi:hypothetical protein
MKDRLRDALGFLPETLKATALLQGFGLWKVPLLFSVRPRVRELGEKKAVVEIRLNRWTKNHLGSMYFGALAIGADCVVGLLATHQINRQGGGSVHLSFKDFQADFLTRPEDHVLFVCEEGEKLARFVEKVLASGERENLTVKAYASTASRPEKPVAHFQLTLSLKRKP